MSEHGDVQWYDVQTDGRYSFRLERGVLNGSAESTARLGDFLLAGLTDVAYVAEISVRYGLGRVIEYLESRTFSGELRGRVADFGEVIAGRLVESHEGHVRPIEKLRYKVRNDSPLYLTDVLCLRMQDEAISAFIFAEVKAGTTAPNKDLGKKALASIVKDWLASMPEILYFVSEKLWQEGRAAEQEQFDEAMYRAEPLPRAFRVIFIFDDAVWDEAVLGNLDADFAGSDLANGDFMCYLLTGEEMRSLILEAFDVALAKGQEL